MTLGYHLFLLFGAFMLVHAAPISDGGTVTPIYETYTATSTESYEESEQTAVTDGYSSTATDQTEEPLTSTYESESTENEGNPTTESYETTDSTESPTLSSEVTDEPETSSTEATSSDVTEESTDNSNTVTPIYQTWEQSSVKVSEIFTDESDTTELTATETDESYSTELTDIPSSGTEYTESGTVTKGSDEPTELPSFTDDNVTNLPTETTSEFPWDSFVTQHYETLGTSDLTTPDYTTSDGLLPSASGETITPFYEPYDISSMLSEPVHDLIESTLKSLDNYPKTDLTEYILNQNGPQSKDDNDDDDDDNDDYNKTDQEDDD